MEPETTGAGREAKKQNKCKIFIDKISYWVISSITVKGVMGWYKKRKRRV